eukprot:gene12540-13826_t
MAEQDWGNFFQSLIQALDEAENATTEQQREVAGLHLEHAVSVLQHVISLVPGESESGQVLATILRNFRLLLAGWRNASSDRCSNVAIYSLDVPPLVQSVHAGRPKFEISEEVLLQLRSIGFTWSQIAEMLLVSRWTIRRRVVEFGLQDVTGYSHISDEELDAKVSQFMQRHGTLVGYSIISGHLKSLGLRNKHSSEQFCCILEQSSRTARNWSPHRIWVNGVLDIRNHENVGVSDIVESSSGEVEWYGYDPRAPAPNDDGLSSVEVLDADPNLPDHILEQLRTEIDPCENSDSFGIDIYLRALNIVESSLAH